MKQFFVIPISEWGREVKPLLLPELKPVPLRGGFWIIWQRYQNIGSTPEAGKREDRIVSEGFTAGNPRSFLKGDDRRNISKRIPTIHKMK